MVLFLYLKIRNLLQDSLCRHSFGPPTTKRLLQTLFSVPASHSSDLLALHNPLSRTVQVNRLCLSPFPPLHHPHNYCHTAITSLQRKRRMSDSRMVRAAGGEDSPFPTGP